ERCLRGCSSGTPPARKPRPVKPPHPNRHLLARNNWHHLVRPVRITRRNRPSPRMDNRLSDRAIRERHEPGIGRVSRRWTKPDSLRGKKIPRSRISRIPHDLTGRLRQSHKTRRDPRTRQINRYAPLTPRPRTHESLTLPAQGARKRHGAVRTSVQTTPIREGHQRTRSTQITNHQRPPRLFLDCAPAIANCPA